MGKSSKSEVIVRSPVISTSIYASGDALGALITFPYAVNRVDGSGLLESVQIIDQAAQNAAMDLVLFSTSPSGQTDNAAVAFTDDEVVNIVAVVSIAAADYDATGTNSVATIPDINIRYQVNEGWSSGGNGKNLYGQLISRGTPTYAATDDLSVAIGITRD